MSLFQTFAEQLEVYGYPVLFVGVLLENAGIPVPGETAVLFAGYLASPAGGRHLHVVWVIICTVIAAVLGDNLGFWLGRRWARPRLQQGKRFLFLTPRTLELAEGYFTRYGIWTIFFARFISGLRVVGALAAGTAGMSWSRFLAANAAGACAWAVSMTLLGYFFGHSFELLHHWLGRGSVILLAALAILLGLGYLRRHLPSVSVGQALVAGAQVAQGLLAALVEVASISLLVLLAQGKHSTHLDAHVDAWIAQNTTATMEACAAWLSVPGTLPVVAGVTAAMIAWLAYHRRPWRESVAILWALLASEALGLILVGLLRYRQVEPMRASLWPFGFAGSVPLRAVAVYGMSAVLLRRVDTHAGRIGRVIAVVLIVLTAVGVVWSREQVLTETLLECAAGAVVLFAGIWKLEGYGASVPAPAN
jgi:membrane protein DedA with SNARE-associated domain